jgi:hypothetical protein
MYIYKALYGRNTIGGNSNLYLPIFDITNMASVPTFGVESILAHLTQGHHVTLSSTSSSNE